MVRLSVVMAVWNGAERLAATLDSIAAQTFRDFELIVVDDGSTDATPEILSRHPSARVITQENAGLTQSLIRGCAAATGEVIARHDAGDVSHPQRFARELALIDRGAVLAACATTFVTEAGETLYTARADGDEVRNSLLHDDAKHIHALPHHGSAMFRRDAYLRAGGYRAAFRVAQDLDLWIRMAPLGPIAIAEEVLYTATFAPSSISGTARAAQVALTDIAVKLRDTGDEALLEQAARIIPSKTKNEAAANYFIAKCLRKNNDRHWRRYLLRALRHNPLHARSWASLLTGR